MPTFLVFADTAEAKRFEASARVLLGLPALAATLQGYVRTGGLHAADAPSGTGENAQGWALRHERYVRHPVDGRFAVRVTAAMQNAWQANKSRLSAAERAWVQDRLASGADLAAEWLAAGELLEDQIVDP